MRTCDFHYELPAELIARHPLAARSDSRLLLLDGHSGVWSDRRFWELPELLQAGDLLVLNDTRVLPARLLGHKRSGGRLECLIERVLDVHCALAQIKANKPLRLPAELLFEGGAAAVAEGREGEFFRLRFTGDESVQAVLERCGHMPLPPYLQRLDEPADRERYQTVFARHAGAVAAPTASLHFDEPLLIRLAERGVERICLTLHVGAGTFQPVRVERIEDHRMHAERFEVSEAVCAAVAQCRARGGRVVAVGTTVLRALEAAAADGELMPMRGETSIFITPGYAFRVVDALLTNFHLPQSTLLMLVCAFAGYGHAMEAYAHAIRANYRFYSYGDAMLITPRGAPAIQGT